MFGRAHESRQIREYPKTYKGASSPYSNFDFSTTTKGICLENLDACAANASLRSSKVIILGDVSVGKTSIVNRFCQQIFDAEYKATIGVDFQVERFDVLSVPFHLQIWDTAGQERFKSIAQSYYRSSHGMLICNMCSITPTFGVGVGSRNALKKNSVLSKDIPCAVLYQAMAKSKRIIVVFDFTRMVTLSNCKSWLRDALHATGNENAFIFLVGTKKDMVSVATFDNIETFATKIAKKLNAEYWAVSSKTNDNINELFFRIAALTFDNCLTKECEKVVDVVIKPDLVCFKKHGAAAGAASEKNNNCAGRNCSRI